MLFGLVLFSFLMLSFKNIGERFVFEKHDLFSWRSFSIWGVCVCALVRMCCVCTHGTDVEPDAWCLQCVCKSALCALYVRTCKFIGIYKYICTNIHVYVCVFRCVHAFLCIQWCVHTHIDKHVWRGKSLWNKWACAILTSAVCGAISVKIVARAEECYWIVRLQDSCVYTWLVHASWLSRLNLDRVCAHNLQV